LQNTAVKSVATSWTAYDLRVLEKAIATGATKVKYSNDKEIEYRSLDEMERVRNLILKEINGGSTNNRVINTEYRR
jgi:hypothetical protein